MVRLLILVALAIVAGLAAAWLADEPGRVVLDWRGWRLEASAVALGVAALVVFLLMAAAFRFLTWLLRDTPLSSTRRNRRRQQKGMAALTAGFNALAAGDGKQARRHARDADRLLAGEPVALLLTAQTAEAGGDSKSAEDAFKRLAARPDSAVLGLRGLVGRALRTDDLRTARQLLANAPDDTTTGGWADQIRFDLAIRDGAWEEADTMFKRLVRHRTVDAPMKARLEAALLYARAREADLAGKTDPAVDLARRALKKDPTLSPAAALAARILKSSGRAPDAEGILTRAWEAAPTPILLDVALAGHEHDSPAERLRRVNDLVRRAPDHTESRIARAALAMEAANWSEARTELESVISNTPGRRAYLMLARLERAQYDNEDAARDWLLEAETAPDDDRWHCTDCGAAREQWSLTCPECTGLATMRWGPLEKNGHAQKTTQPHGERRSLLAGLGAPVQ